MQIEVKSLAASFVQQLAPSADLREKKLLHANLIWIILIFPLLLVFFRDFYHYFQEQKKTKFTL